MLSYIYPLMGVFWSMLIFTGMFMFLFFILWCFVDNFRRRDHHGLAKAAWTVCILFLPVVGALAYVLARPASVDLYVVQQQGTSAAPPRAA